MSQHLNTLKICERNNGRSSKWAFFRHRNNNLVAENGSNNEKHRFLVVGLEKVVISRGNCQGNRLELELELGEHFARAILRRN